jgi:hypothetical protein
MLPKQFIINWTQKFIHGWLIFCVGGVGSLTYFDGLLPGHTHGEHPFHLSIFEESPHVHNPLPPLPEDLAERARFWLVSRLNPQTDMLNAAQTLAHGLSHFFASDLSGGYLLTAAHLKIFALFVLFGSVALAALDKRSAWLPPPDKPPIFLSQPVFKKSH